MIEINRNATNFDETEFRHFLNDFSSEDYSIRKKARVYTFKLTFFLYQLF